MAWSTIRQATSIDHSNLKRAAVRFCTRHNIAFESESSALGEIEFVVSINNSSRSFDVENNGRRLRPLWSRIVKRTLGHSRAQGIAYGYVGYNVD